MPAVGDFLARFRPAGAPGPAAGAVPADRRAELEAELQQVFALLTGPEAERRTLIDEADRAARRIREEAAESAALLVERARVDAGAIRAEAAAEVRAAVRGEHDALLAEARREADEIGRTADERLPGLVAEAVASVRALAGAAQPGRETPERDAGIPETGGRARTARNGTTPRRGRRPRGGPG